MSRCLCLFLLIIGTCWSVEPQVATGENSSYYLAENGTVWAWGRNHVGQLGDGTTTPRLTPVQVPGLSNIIQIRAGLSHAVALRVDGRVFTWGDNTYGQLGDGTTGGSRSSPYQVASGIPFVRHIAAGGFHTLAISTSGTGYGWGYNGVGTLGVGDFTHRNVPSLMTGGHLWREFAGGGFHSLGIRDDGRVLGWGWNSDGQVGDATNISKNVPTLTSLTNVISIAAGYSHSLAVTSSGNGMAWGLGFFGQLANASTTSSNVPIGYGGVVESVSAGHNHSIFVRSNGFNAFVGLNSSGQCRQPTTTSPVHPPNSITGIRRVATGFGNHSLVIEPNGLVRSWGNNVHGQLGIDSSGGTTHIAQTVLATWQLTGIMQVVRGQSHAAALKADGTVWSWGANYNGQLGIGDAIGQHPAPVQTQLGTTALRQITAGVDFGDHTMGLMHSGQAWAWGNNSSGQVGINSFDTPQATPVQVQDATNYRSIGGGDNHSLAILSSGGARAWGSNGSGESGQADTSSNVALPTSASGTSNLLKVAAGTAFSVGLRADGSVVAWGLGGSGQLGNGGFANSSTAVTVSLPVGIRIIDIAAGNAHALALASNGEVYAWGNNGSGQLGLGSTGGGVATPTLMRFSAGVATYEVVALGAGTNFSMVIWRGGNLYTTGTNGNGELAMNDNTQRTYLSWTGTSNIVQMNGGWRGAVALLADGTVRAWGNGGSGQLGNGGIGNSLVPIAATSLWLPEIAVNLAGSSLNGVEGGILNPWVRLTRTGSTVASMTVNLSLGGSATYGSDYSSIPLTATFPAGSAAVNVSIPITNDSIAEDAETVQFTLLSGSSYLLGGTVNATVTINDNDTAAVLVSPVAGLITTEGGGTANFSVSLQTEPLTQVRVTATSSNINEGTIAASLRYFGPVATGDGSGSSTTNLRLWSNPLSFTITGVDDDVDDGDVGYNVTFTVASGDTKYNGIAAPSVSVTNVDNDTAGFTVTPTTGLSTSEDGISDTFTVRLDSRPTADVTVTLSSSNAAEATVTPTQITFTPATWNITQDITVKGVDDAVADGTQPFTIILAAATSLDPKYQGLNPADVTGNNADNDSKGIVVGQSGGDTSVIEGGANDSITVRLNSQPTGPVTITLTPNAQVTTNPTSLAFTPLTWNQNQIVTIGAVDDAQIEMSPHPGSVQLTAAGSDYAAGVTPATVPVAITDNDVASIITTPAALTITEGQESTFKVQLTAQPTAAVTLSVTSANTLIATVDVATLTFLPGDWDTLQTVTVTAELDGNALTDITVINLAIDATADTDFAGAGPWEVDVEALDIDQPGITITETLGATAVNEPNGSDTYAIRLNSTPDPGTFVAIGVTAPSGVTVSPGTLFFTDTDFNVNQVVTVTVVDDSLAQGNRTLALTHAVAFTSDTVNYPTTLPLPPLNVAVGDDDVSGIVVAPSTGLTVTEAGGTATFTISLQSRPLNNHSVQFTATSQTSDKALVSNDGTTFAVSAAVTFTAATWSTPRTITIRGVDDDIAGGDLPYAVNLVSTSVDAAYNAQSLPQITGLCIDNDTVAVVLSTTSVTATEGGAGDTYTVQLATAPTAPVVIDVNADSQLSASPTRIFFSAGGAIGGAGTEGDPRAWDSPFTVTVNAIDDDFAEGAHTGTIRHSATDGGYSSVVISEVTATITDNNTPGFTLTPPTGVSLTVQEAFGGMATALVSDSITGSTVQFPAATDLSPFFVGQAAYLLDQQVWVVVTAVNDGTDQLTIAGDFVDATSEAIAFAAGFRVTLSSRPTSLVIIGFASDDSNQAQVLTPNLTFTPENWDQAQTVSLLGIDNAIDDGDIAFNITSTTATSADPFYTGLTATPIAFTSIDDDSAGVLVDPVAGLTVDESGTQAAFTVELTSEPTATVTIPLSLDDPDHLSLGAVSSLTFTPSDWNVPQTVTITGSDGDGINNPPGGVPVTVLLGEPTISSGTDAQYDAFTATDIADVVVTVMPYNFAPTLDTVDTLLLDEDDTPLAVTLTGIGTGQSGEVQTLSIGIVVDNELLVTASAPSAIAAGESTFTLTPVADAFGTTTVTVTVTDDNTIDGTARDSSVTFQVVVSPINDAPVVNLDGVGPVDGFDAGIFTEGDSAMAIVDNVALSVDDVDNVTASSARAVLAAAPDGAAEILAVQNFPSFAAAYDTTTRTLTITATPPQTHASFEAILRTLTYRNTSAAPTLGGRSVAIVVNDGDLDSSADTATFTVAGVNDDPALDLNADAGGTGFAATWTEGSGPVVIVSSTALVITDPDSATLAQATAVLAPNTDAPAEVLAVDVTGTSITAAWAGSTLTLSGVASLADYQQVLRTLTYNSSSQDPTVAARTVTVTVDDGAGGTAAAESTITLVAVNGAPALDLDPGTVGTGFATTFTEDGGPVAAVANNLLLTDLDSDNLTGATAQILPAVLNPGVEILAVTPFAGITVAFDTGSGVLSLTGNRPVADYQTILRSLTYDNQSPNPDTSARSIQISVDDGGLNGVTTALASITIVAVNNAPVIDLNGPVAGIDMTTPITFLEGMAPLTMFSGAATVGDADSTTLVSASVTLTNALDGADETLALGTAVPGITATFDAGTGVLSLSGAATLAEYQLALNAVTYANASQAPTGYLAPGDEVNDRLFNVTASDGAASATIAIGRVRVLPVNDRPELTISGTVTLALGGTLPLRYDPSGVPGAEELVLTATDPDHAVADLVYIVPLRPNLGQLRRDSVPLNNGDSFTAADLQAGLLEYVHGGLLAGADGFALLVEDPQGEDAVAVITLTITGLVPPSVTINDTTPVAWTEGDAAVQLDASAGISDPDSANFATGSVLISYANGGGRTGDTLLFNPALIGGVLTLDGTTIRNGDGDAVATLSGGTNGTSLTAGLTAFATPAVTQTVLRGISWQSTSQDPGAAQRELAFIVNDGSLDSTVVVRRINVTPVNDPPTDLGQTVILTVPRIARAGQIATIDPEGDVLTFAIEPDTGPTKGGLGSSLNVTTGAFVYTPFAAVDGADAFSVRVTDANGASTLMTVDIMISDLGSSVRFVSNPPMVATEGDSLLHVPTVITSGLPDGTPLTYELIGGSGLGIALSPSDGTLSWPTIPPAADGYHAFGILVTEPTSQSAAYLPVLLQIIPAGGGGG